MSRSTVALLITIMFHLLLFFLFNFFLSLAPKEEEKPKENRIKISLKENPKPSPKKSAAITNKNKIEKAPSMPKGKQLKKPEKKSIFKKPKPKETTPIRPKKTIEKKPAQVAKKIEKKSPPPLVETEKKTTNIKEVSAKNRDLNISKKPEKKKSNLYAQLIKKPKVKTEEKIKTDSAGTQIGSDFKEAYGEAFGKLSEGEKKYIIDNQEIMRRITQEQLNRLAPVNIPRNLRVNTMNIIEFYLHPNGDISGLKLISNSSVEILDETSLQTVEYSYHRYPLPKQKTLIRYRVDYWFGGRRF